MKENSKKTNVHLTPLKAYWLANRFSEMIKEQLLYKIIAIAKRKYKMWQMFATEANHCRFTFEICLVFALL